MRKGRQKRLKGGFAIEGNLLAFGVRQVCDFVKAMLSISQ
jgi:hypothetical protein